MSLHSIADQSLFSRSLRHASVILAAIRAFLLRAVRHGARAPPHTAPEAIPADPVERRTTRGSHRPQHLHGGNLADSGPDSLRAAITAANANPGADVIAFAHGLRGTVALTSGELGITDDLRIDGPGAGRLAVSGSDASRVFNISSGVAASIDDLTITHGHGFLRGGGILNAGTLTLSDAVVSDNVVVGLPGMGADVDPFGGGILNTGTLSVSHTTFIHNQSLGADGDPGGPGSTGLGGAIMSVGTAERAGHGHRQLQHLPRQPGRRRRGRRRCPLHPCRPRRGHHE